MRDADLRLDILRGRVANRRADRERAAKLLAATQDASLDDLVAVICLRLMQGNNAPAAAAVTLAVYSDPTELLRRHGLGYTKDDQGRLVLMEVT